MSEGDEGLGGAYAPPATLEEKRSRKKRKGKSKKRRTEGWFDELVVAVDEGERESVLRRMAKEHAEDDEDVEGIVEDAREVVRLQRRVAGTAWTFWLGGGLLLLGVVAGGISLVGLGVVVWNAVRRDRMQKQARALREAYR